MKQMTQRTSTVKKSVEYVANNYDLLYADHVKMHRSTIKNFSARIADEPKTILVVACGTGIDLTTLKPLGWKSDLYGFDLLPEFIEKARANLGKEGMSANSGLGIFFIRTWIIRET